MAEMTTAQIQALGGMNISSDEEKLEELKAIQAKIKAEEARIKAEIAAKKAAEAHAQADAQLIAQANAVTAATAQGLKGQRDEDGNLIPALDEQMFEDIADEPTSNIVGGVEELEGFGTKDINEVIEGLEFTGKDSKDKRIITEASILAGFIDRGKFVASPEFQAKFGNKYDKLAEPLEVTITKGSTEDEVIEADAEAKWQELMDIDQNIRTDEMSEKMRHGGIDPEEGRTKPVESDARSEKPGWEVAEGGNTWSINEKDDYWKTQEGFDEAVALYGSKPAWVKEPTLVYNPETEEYEEIEEEEFEDLSRPAVSAEVKKLFG
jgi:hypothetical protein